MSLCRATEPFSIIWHTCGASPSAKRYTVASALPHASARARRAGRGPTATSRSSSAPQQHDHAAPREAHHRTALRRPQLPVNRKAPTRKRATAALQSGGSCSRNRTATPCTGRIVSPTHDALGKGTATSPSVRCRTVLFKQLRVRQSLPSGQRRRASSSSSVVMAAAVPVRSSGPSRYTVASAGRWAASASTTMLLRGLNQRISSSSLNPMSVKRSPGASVCSSIAKK
mmetsp:Transcript_6782/g.27769  ORF Transcript_6782/g.27769 Transcript_6782/m.27769 type:complete len:228 (-) Transcript_6782:4503-5186(-)